MILDDKITVIARIRPILQSEQFKDVALTKLLSKTEEKLVLKYRSDTLYTNFRKVLSPSDSTDQLSQNLSQVIERSISGKDTTIITYGHTSSGKSYTLYGSKSEKGLCQLMIGDLLKLTNIDSNYSVSISFYEIYLEKICDLLLLTSSQNGRNFSKNKSNCLKLRLNPFDKMPYLPDLNKIEV